MDIGNFWGGSRGGSGGSVELPKAKRKYFYHTFTILFLVITGLLK